SDLWDERPLLLVRPSAAGEAPSFDEMREFLTGRIAKWWLPDAMEVVDELPHTATGKISKLTLRELYADYRLPT
ncbi:MAG: long-chain fatty acid--CoA ligase, partial [Acidobacteriota bacterium]